MKTIVVILLLALIFQGIVMASDLISVKPVEPYLINTILQNGPARLQIDINEERLVPKYNLKEKLEQKLIETRLIQQSG